MKQKTVHLIIFIAIFLVGCKKNDTSPVAPPSTLNQERIFAGTTAGVFLSTDNGTSWSAVDSGLTNTRVRAFAVSGTNLFAGTLCLGIFLSTNDGTSWTAVDSGFTRGYCHDVYALAVSGTNIFAGTQYDGVFLSTNNGISWTAVNTGLPSVPLGVNAFAISGTNLFVGMCDSTVFVSNNNGSSWRAANNGLPNKCVISLAASGSNIFAGTSGLYRSTDGGGSWMKLSSFASITVNCLLVCN